jgi:hypothetical protein
MGSLGKTNSLYKYEAKPFCHLSSLFLSFTFVSRSLYVSKGNIFVFKILRKCGHNHIVTSLFLTHEQIWMILIKIQSSPSTLLIEYLS